MREMTFNVPPINLLKNSVKLLLHMCLREGRDEMVLVASNFYDSSLASYIISEAQQVSETFFFYQLYSKIRGLLKCVFMRTLICISTLIFPSCPIRIVKTVLKHPNVLQYPSSQTLVRFIQSENDNNHSLLPEWGHDLGWN